MAITPLKKTPPHIMILSDEANLSPARHSKPIRSNLPLSSLVNQSSLGFHPVAPHQSASADPSDTDNSSDGESDSSLDSKSDSENTRTLREEKGVSNLYEPKHQHGKLSYGLETRALYDGSQIKATTRSEHSSEGSQMMSSMLRDHPAAQPPPNQKISKKKRNNVESLDTAPKRPKNSTHGRKKGGSEKPTSFDGVHADKGVSDEAEATVSSLIVKISVADLKIPDSLPQVPKPKATVEPYNVVTIRTPHRRNTSDSMQEPEEVIQGRDRYSRLRNNEYPSSGSDFHGSRGERSRVHPRWETSSFRDHRVYVSSHGSGRGGDYGRGSHGWEREHYRPSGGEDYWSDTGSHYDNPRMDSQRSGGGGSRGYPRQQKKGPDYYMQEAKRRKRDADKITVSEVVWTLVTASGRAYCATGTRTE